MWIFFFFLVNPSLQWAHITAQHKISQGKWMQPLFSHRNFANCDRITVSELLIQYLSLNCIPLLSFWLYIIALTFMPTLVNSAKFSTKEYNHVSPNINKNGTTVK